MKKLIGLLWCALCIGVIYGQADHCDPTPGTANTLCEDIGEIVFDDTYLEESGDVTFNSSDDDLIGLDINSEVDIIIAAGAVFTIRGSRIRMEPDTRITVGVGATLIIRDSYFWSCSEMWKGIETRSGSRIVFVGNHIEDAEIALKYTGVEQFHVDDNIFNRNLIGMWFEPPRRVLDDAEVVNYIRVSANEFTCDSELSNIQNTSDWDDWENEEFSLAGIAVFQLSNITIGSTIGTPNTFSEQLNGIVSVFNDITIINSRFTDIYDDAGTLADWIPAWLNIPTPFGSKAHIAIDVYGGHLTLEGLGSTSTSNTTIENAHLGIWHEAGISNISGCRFKDVDNGIQLMRATRWAVIEDCRMDYSTAFDPCSTPYPGSLFGVVAFLPGGAPPSIEIHDITVGENGSAETLEPVYGVLLENIPKAFAEISDNDLTADEIGVLIHGFGWSKILVEGNGYPDGQCFAPGGYAGLHIDNYRGDELEISFNRFGGTNCAHGLVIQDCMDGLYCSNWFPDAGTGLKISGDGGSLTRLTQNIFEGQNKGLVHNNATFNPQIHFGNIWRDSRENFGQYAAENIPVDQTDFVPYVVNSGITGNPEYLPDPTITSGPTGWFTDVSGSLSGCVAALTDTTWTPLDSLISIDSATFPTLANKWNYQLYLYQKGKKFESLVEEKDSFGAFMEKMEATNIDSFYHVLELMNNTWELDSEIIDSLETFEEVLQSYRDSISILFDTLHSLDTAIINDTISPLIDVSNSLLSRFIIEDSLYSMLLDDIQDEISENLAVAMEFNNQIDSTKKHDYNMKYVLRSTLESMDLDFDGFSQDTFNALVSLAEACPNEEGYAVYFARSLVAHDTSISYTYCIPTSQQSSKVNTHNIKTGLKIYPNPSMEFVTLETFPPQSLKLINIISISGQVVYNKSIEHLGVHSVQINVNTFMSGTYIAQVTTHEGSMFNQKITIAR